MNRSVLSSFLLILVLALAACVPSNNSLAESHRPRDKSPDAAAADVSELAAGNSAFAFDFYQAIRASDGNLFYSPYSISLALSMASAGARGDTLAQMRDALRFTLPDERLHPAFNALDLELNARPEQSQGLEIEQPLIFHSVNALWGQQGYPFLREFLDLLARNYGAGMRLADFMTDAENAREQINAWVSDQTEDRIRDLIPENALNADSRLVLVNAVYFKAAWREPFSNRLTDEAPFTLLDGSQVNVPMMSMEEPASLPYSDGEGYQVFALPYQGGRTEMVVILPDAGRFEEIEAGLSGDGFGRMLTDMRYRGVVLRMPKFEFTSQYELSEVFRSLGMTDAFDRGLADFSGMAGNQELYISAIAHKAFVAVDEEGTEAAAATGVMMEAVSLVLPDLEITVDRPFVFVIYDMPTGSILFLGRVLKP